MSFSAAGPEQEVELQMHSSPPRPVRLVDAEARAVPGATLQVMGVGDLDLGHQLMLITRTNDEGLFDAAGLPAGLLRIDVHAPETAPHQLELHSDSLTEELVLPRR